MKYEIRPVRDSFLLVQTSTPREGVTGIAALMKLTSYVRDSHDKVRRFPSAEAAQAFIDKLKPAVV